MVVGLRPTPRQEDRDIVSILSQKKNGVNYQGGHNKKGDNLPDSFGLTVQKESDILGGIRRRRRMNLFYTINDAFVPQLGAAVCSVCENNRGAGEIVFYIGAMEVTEEHQAQLRELAAGYGREMRFIPIDHLQERLGFDFDTLGWSEVVVARLLMDRLLPEDVERVLYLDGDTIVIGDLGPLWEKDMGGCVMGACVEPTANRERKKALGLEGKPYFNSGVLLIDLKKWRETKAAEKVLDFYREKGGRLFAPDQDALNGGLAGQIRELPPKYNFYNIYWYYPYRTLVKIYRPAVYMGEAEFRESAEHPVILHYLGEDRPWRKGSRHRYGNRYEEYLGKTPWKDEPKEEGWEAFLGLYHAFWKIMKPFPMFCYRVIDGLIPAMMKYRKRQRTK